MTQQPAKLRRRFTDPNTDEVFDVVYSNGRVIVSDGLREVAFVPAGQMSDDGYRLDLKADTPHRLFAFELYATPAAALNGACEFLYQLRGSGFDPAAQLEQLVRELPQAPAQSVVRP